MKGISVFTAVALIADIATIERFENARHLTSYLRRVPGVDSSNETTNNLKTNKFGRKLSVSLLSQALNHFRDSKPQLHRWYEKKVADKPKGTLRLALCRKVFTAIYQRLAKKEDHYFRDIENQTKKLKEYNKLLERYDIRIEDRNLKNSA
ncbi:MAG: transposase [Spirochaetota bacterium]